jgi:alpha-mannosidase
VDTAHVVLETVKHAEQDEAVVLRFYEAFGGRGEVCLHTPLAVHRADDVDLMENKLGALPVKKDEQGSIVPFDIKPYEIKTLKLWIEPGGRACG